MPTESEIELVLLLDAIRLRYGYDFRSYVRSSLERRLARAMTHLGCRSLSALQGRVLREPWVMHELLGYLTVRVSDMFRDPGFFRAIREKVVPHLETYPSLRVWVAGCASGEEVYSVAILLEEEGLLQRTTIYATDINGEALRTAEAGIYPLARFADFSKAYRASGGQASLADYYTAGYDSAVFDRRLREHVVFSDHSLATDSVFAEVQLVSCRNVLIYFDRPLQDRAIALFRDALCREGFLGLGPKETLAFSPHAGDFLEFVREERLYRRR